jgi:hypothetical protein
MLVYQTRLEYLCEQAIQEQDQEKLRELLDEILRLLAELQQDSQKPH